ncbi:MAG TPA: hypothetical protein DCS07_00100 [Bdellovibrionales bacterium]|nr:MAG: hypothetical protein A2X97_09395 [Bdellovibrionales bacterium GWA1_52_35]HAR41033.1 hypothetical protein [Bdellovibrionales bacterium]HCM38908.1 hypothetical protein [Bdellovibrionales bacterium]
MDTGGPGKSGDHPSTPAIFFGLIPTDKQQEVAPAEVTALLVLKKKRAYSGEPGRTSDTENRQQCISLVREVELGGAGRATSCEVLEVSLRTIKRWEQNPDQGDHTI